MAVWFCRGMYCGVGMSLMWLMMLVINTVILVTNYLRLISGLFSTY